MLLGHSTEKLFYIHVHVHNIRHICLTLLNILINVYCEATEFIVDGMVLASEECTMQGDPLIMPMCTLSWPWILLLPMMVNH